MRDDPFPRQLLLTKQQVAEVLGWDESMLNEFLRDPEESRTFPKSTKLGKTRNGKPRPMWSKWKVYAWIELTMSGEDQNSPGNRDNPRS